MTSAGLGIFLLFYSFYVHTVGCRGVQDDGTNDFYEGYDRMIYLVNQARVEQGLAKMCISA
jgi:hypothetical protein